VVVCHGFKGFKDWGFFPHASETLAARLGCHVVSFNFSGSGVGEDLETFSEPESFGRNTFSKECADLDAILDGLAAGQLGDLRIPRAESVGILGHSRGGVAAILAGERPGVSAVTTWAAISSPFRYADAFENVGPGGFVEVTNARTGDVLPLYRDVVDDMEANPQRFDLESSLRRSAVALLVVHGTEDAAVSVSDAHQLADAGMGARLELIPGAGHTFEVGHPFAGPSPELSTAIDFTVEHFADQLEPATQ
jgi:pimeloyl-ACP methyl ester carboxylesterase